MAAAPWRHRRGSGQLVQANGAGRKLRRRAWSVYAAATQEAIGDRLSDAVAAGLAALLDRIAGARPSPDPRRESRG